MVFSFLTLCGSLVQVCRRSDRKTFEGVGLVAFLNELQSGWFLV